jgi:ribosomal protein S18 acetylase RimI-like enzyme
MLAEQRGRDEARDRRRHGGDAVTDLERALRDAFRALAPIAEASGRVLVPESDLDVDSLASELRSVTDWVLDRAYVAERGAQYSWKTNNRDLTDWTPEIVTVNLDDEDLLDEDWLDSALHRVAVAYKWEARWDFPPGESGIWLLQATPTTKHFSEDDLRAPVTAFGHIVAFAVVHDRDDDGVHESLAHVWTARTWRRQGLASQLLAHAREHYAIRMVEGPATSAGVSLLRACHAELLDRPEGG